jgi:hydroxymethylbilane synthase
MRVLRLATRQSPLALRQTSYVQGRLRQLGIECTLVNIETHGDLHFDAPLETLGGQGIFALEVQKALIDGTADVAVHSAKDLPSTTPEELALVCVPERRDAADALVGRSLVGLGPGATVATGSPRRRALLLERRPDLRIVGLRGNMATRLAVAGHDGVDAVVAAAAALERLDEVDLISERLDTEWFVPQVGQGALALEARIDDPDTHRSLDAINDVVALRAVEAERAFLRELGAGCATPAGAYATINGVNISLSGVMLAVDGSQSVRATLVGDDPLALGRDLAIALRDTMHGNTLTGWHVAR